MMAYTNRFPLILMYHSIEEDPEEPCSVSVNNFHNQVLWLIDNGYSLVSLAAIVDLIRFRDYKNLKGKVVFTFDDGYKDFLSVALPILLSHGIPATVFIVTGMIGGKALWSKNRKHARLMSEEDIKYIMSNGINIGSHGMTHTDLTALDKKKLNWQLVESRVRLVELGESFYAFSYPWGQYSSMISEAVRSADYTCAVSVDGNIRSDQVDLYQLPRITMKADMNLKSFQYLFDGYTQKVGHKIYNAAKKMFFFY